jgi:hypothetical protein
VSAADEVRKVLAGWREKPGWDPGTAWDPYTRAYTTPAAAAAAHDSAARALPWYCEQCGRMHPLGGHDPPPSGERCEFAGSLYCARGNCPNPRHKAHP